MKKTLLIVALAAVLVFAFATPAFAKYAGYKAATQYVPWAEANALASMNADAALMAQGPHAGYATTTVKCAVCHSVHRAGSKLLNEGAACAYCHTSVANGGGAVASDLISWTATNGGPHSARCANTDCHGGPHGVGASTYAGSASRLLTAAGDAEVAELLAADTLVGGAVDMTTWNAEARVIGTAGVCQRSGCHNNSMMGVVTAGAATDVSVGTTQTVTGHRVIAAATAQWDGPAYGSTMTSKAIAFKPVEYCNSCHDLTDDNNAGKEAFPHAITDVVSAAQGKVAGHRNAVWLTAAPDSDTVSTVVGTYNDYSGTDGADAYAAGGGIVDGVCLKCHKSSTAGLGITY